MVVFMEVMLRLLIPAPLYISQDRTLHNGESTPYIAPDEVLGWRYRPGRYSFREVDDVIEKSICEDYGRATDTSCASTDTLSLKSVYFVGDSYTHGTGLSDHQTLAWKFKLKFPEYDVRNYGVGGFGACQVYRRIEDVLKEVQGGKFYVVYGFSDFHIARAVANPVMDYQVARRAPGKISHYPVCYFDKDMELVSLPSRKYMFEMPFLSSSYVSNLFMNLYLVVWSRYFTPEEQGFAADFFSALRDLVENSGGSLLVLMQDFSNESSMQWYRDLFEGMNITYINGSGYNADSYRLSDNHPNDRLNTMWLEMLEPEFVEHKGAD
jgi:hypothetical protein